MQPHTDRGVPQATQPWAHLRCRRAAQREHLSTPALTSSFPTLPQDLCSPARSLLCVSAPKPAGQGAAAAGVAAPLAEQVAVSSGSLTGKAPKMGLRQQDLHSAVPSPRTHALTPALPSLGSHRPQNHTGRPSVRVGGDGTCLTPRCKGLSPRSVDISERLPKSGAP